MTELLGVNPIHLAIHFIQQGKPRTRDSRQHVTAILSPSLACDEFGLLEPVKEPRHIRRFAHETLADFVSTQAVWLRAAKDSQDVVLRRRDPVWLQRGFEGVLQERRGPENAQACLFPQTPERFALFEFRLEL